MKKFGKIALMLALCSTVLIGCSTKKETSEVSDEKPTLRQLGFKRNFDPNADPMAKFLEEKTGYKVNYEVLPMENTDNKLNLMMANKEEIDILKLSATQYNKLASEGALEPLDKLLEKYGDNILKANSEDSWKAALVDGETYGIPERAPRPFVGDALGIRSDILEQVGMEVPKTIDEFYDLLVAIKEKTGLIPMTGDQAILHQISGAFGVNATWFEEDGKIKNRVEQKGMEDYIQFMQKLYDEELIDKEWPINDSQKARDKFTSGKAAILASYGWGMSAVVLPVIQEEFNADIELIMGLKGPDGKQGAWLEGTGVSWFIAIPKVSKNKEHAVKYLNMKLESELFKDASIGQEGKHWEMKDGKMQPILPAFADDRNNSDWFMTSSIAKDYQEYWLLRTRKDPIMAETFDKMQAQVEYGKEEAITMAPPLEKASRYSQRLQALESDYIINAISDKKSAKPYADFLKDWENEGGLESKEDYNAWLKEFNK